MPDGPDFSSVTSRQKAEDLCAEGVLVRTLLLPEDFGGTDDARNVVYVPAWVAELKTSTEQNIVRPLCAEGELSSYKVVPEYEGGSFVPVSVQIEASDPGSFTKKINIWGRALRTSEAV